jgi:hypothetical protein
MRASETTRISYVDAKIKLTFINLETTETVAVRIFFVYY